MSNFVLGFFFVQMSWIFACGLRFNRKSQPCIFFHWFALHFRVKTYAKNSRLQDASLVSLFGKTIGFFCLARLTTDCKKRRRVFCIRFNWKTKRKPAEKNTGLWLSIKSETTCKNSAHLDEKKTGPKFDIEWLCSKVFNYLFTFKSHHNWWAALFSQAEQRGNQYQINHFTWKIKT